MGDDVRRRTVRAQVTNGALAAKAYQGPTGIPAQEDAHKTFEMQTVAVAREADPRFRNTVARGMGEAVQTLEGDIVDPETGRVLPPVGADPNPNSPWRVGKRPTKLELPRPDPHLLLATTGVASSRASRPGLVAYLAAAVVVVAAVAVALFFANRAREQAARPTGAEMTPGGARPPAPAPAAADVPAAEMPAAETPAAPPPASAGAGSPAPGAGSAVGAATAPTPKVPGTPTGQPGSSPARAPASPPASPPGTPSRGGRIF